MIQTKSLCVFLISYFVLQSNAEYEPNFKPCKADDRECLVSSAQKGVPVLAAGVPELGVPPADPIVLDYIQCDEKNLKLTFEHNRIVGPGKSNITDIIRDTEKGTITVVSKAPIYITGKYDMQGKILFIPAVGNGDYELKTDRMGFSIVLKHKTVEKDGKKYLKITGFDYTYDLEEKVHMKLDNLFGGNEIAAKPVQELMDTHWKDVILEFGDCIFTKVLTSYVNVIKQYLLSIPLDKLEL